MVVGESLRIVVVVVVGIRTSDVVCDDEVDIQPTYLDF